MNNRNTRIVTFLLISLNYKWIRLCRRKSDLQLAFRVLFVSFMRLRKKSSFCREKYVCEFQVDISKTDGLVRVLTNSDEYRKLVICYILVSIERIENFKRS